MGPKRKSDEPSEATADDVKEEQSSVVGSLATSIINPFNSKTVLALTMVCKTIGVECKKDLDSARKDEDLQYYLECMKIYQDPFFDTYYSHERPKKIASSYRDQLARFARAKNNMLGIVNDNKKLEIERHKLHQQLGREPDFDELGDMFISDMTQLEHDTKNYALHVCVSPSDNYTIKHLVALGF